MNLISQIEAALSGDALENTAVTDAQAIVTIATSDVAVATTTLADAETALQTDIDNSDDTTDSQAAVDAATIALADADTALTEANADLTTAQGEAGSADTLALIAELKVTDYNMISDATMALILAAQGKEVLFDTPETVISNHAMEIVTPCTTDVTPVGK